MPKRDKRIDAYIANAAEFAQPILMYMREQVHASCPEVEETMKWSFPHFDYHGIMCHMASFKQHCTFGFWKAALLQDAVTQKSSEALGQFGRITSIKDLPTKKVMASYIKRAMKLNEDGVTVPKSPAKVAARKSAAPVVPPPALIAALTKNRKALDSFDAFSPSHRKEYIEWITEAKTDTTRERRIQQAIEMMSEGKSRNWKYQR